MILFEGELKGCGDRLLTEHFLVVECENFELTGIHEKYAVQKRCIGLISEMSMIVK